MIYAQIKKGQKLHLAYEAGEGRDNRRLVPAGYVSDPICGRSAPEGYRMVINIPLGNACKRCLRVYVVRTAGR